MSVAKSSSKLSLTYSRVLRRSLACYWRQSAALMLVVALAVAVLTGALVVGWSLERSLVDRLAGRLAGVTGVLELTRPVGLDLLLRLRGSGLGPVGGGLELRGIASSAEGETPLAIPVTVWGVEGAGAGLVGPTMPRVEPGQVVVNEQLARELGVRPGDWLAVRVDGSLFQADAGPFTHRKPASLSKMIRVQVGQVLPSGGAGDFSLAETQLTPANVFMPIEELGRAMGTAARVNRLFLAGEGEGPRVAEVLRHTLTVEDLGLQLRNSELGGLVQTSAIVLPESLLSSAGAREMQAGEVATFLAEEIASGEGRVSYGVVAGARAVVAAGSDLAADEVVLNDWVAADLQVKVGDRVTLRVLIGRPDGSYGQEPLELKVARVERVGTGLFVPEVVTELPGMTDIQRIDKWDAPFPVDMERVSGRDEAYWEQYRATPKAIVNEQLLQTWWRKSGFSGGRAVTSLVLPKAMARDAVGRTLVTESLRGDPQWAVKDVLAHARAAGRGSSDFAVLFTSMSLFLVVSAVIIAVSVTRLAVEARGADCGLAAAMGLNGTRWLAILLVELLVAVMLGAVVGCLAGVGYAQALLGLFRHLAQGVWELPPLEVSVRGLPLVMTVFGVVGVVMGIGWWHGRRLIRRPVKELLWGAGETAGGRRKTRGRWHIAVGVVALISAVGVGVAARSGKLASGEGFFVAALLLLMASWILTRFALGCGMATARALTLRRLWWRSMQANPRRTMLSWGMYVMASFTLASVALYRTSMSEVNPYDRSGPTGGFVTRLTSPIAYRYDLEREEGRKRLGLRGRQATLGDGVRVYSLVTSGGTEGGCLNLARPAEMQALGVPPGFVQRGGFSIATASAADNPWTLLEHGDGDAIPVIGDEETMQWILERALGDEFEIPIGGRPVRVKLVGLVRGGLFSGQWLMSEANLRRICPTATGYRVHFVEARPGQAVDLSGFAEMGMAVESTRSLVEAVGAVQRVYMSLFLVLGSLGLVLGTAGSVSLLVRDALGRQGELALMQSAGLSRWQGTLVLACGHLAPAAGGLVAGCGSAAIAYVAVGQRMIEATAVLVPVGTAILAAILMFVTARLLQPRELGGTLRNA